MNRPDTVDIHGADLQADVMRFLAIFALAMLAISTIGVVTIKENRTAPPVTEATEPSISAPEPTMATIVPPVIETKAVRPETPAAPSPPTIEREIVSPMPPAPAANPETANDAPRQAAIEPGTFLLRFRSDPDFEQALSAGHATLYGRAGGKVWRFDASAGRFVMVPSTPAAHGVDGRRLPQSILAAIVRAAGVRPDPGSGWVIHLSRAVAARLENQMQRHAGGVLIVDGDGHVELARGDTGT